MSNAIRTVNISEVTDNINAVETSINNFGLNKIEQSVQDMNSSFDQVSENRKQVDEARHLVDVLFDIVGVKMSIWLNDLSVDTLSQIILTNEHGYVDLVTQMMSVYDNFTDYVNESLSNISAFHNFMPKSSQASDWKKNSYYTLVDTVTSSELPKIWLRM
eukprot:TRINITY_DN8174_c0_g1_i1.p2 TRINITY_DN8174_c0_g1~~TRINITY_DN8174_c0_g1_i1.p2  ORF type:complete len:160 (-),score=10.18 TRINITY_DN8174_c0_g1_i1:476-955(-)